MNHSKNWLLACVGVLSVAGLVGCQSTSSATATPPEKMHGKHAHFDKKHHDKKHRGEDRNLQHKKPRLTEEQRAEWQKKRETRQAKFQQLQAACEGKTAGQTVNVQFGEKAIQGKCELRFQPVKPSPATAQAS